MADRIIAMRAKLYDALIELKTPGEWGHIKSQIGQSTVTHSGALLASGYQETS